MGSSDMSLSGDIIRWWLSQVSAFEYRRIEGLTADPPPGLKVLVIEPWVRRGMLLLSSENTVVLGGEVRSTVNISDGSRND